MFLHIYSQVAFELSGDVDLETIVISPELFAFHFWQNFAICNHNVVVDAFIRSCSFVQTGVLVMPYVCESREDD